MKNTLILILISLFFNGCLYVNDRGISTQLYNECKEYYDSMGVYHKVCDKNLIEYEDVKQGIENTARTLDPRQLAQ